MKKSRIKEVKITEAPISPEEKKQLDAELLKIYNSFLFRSGNTAELTNNQKAEIAKNILKERS